MDGRLASIFIGVWGFIGTWLIEGLVALIVFLASGGEPGALVRIYTTEMALASVFALAISGSLGFWVIFDTVLYPRTRKS